MNSCDLREFVTHVTEKASGRLAAGTDGFSRVPASLCLPTAFLVGFLLGLSAADVIALDPLHCVSHLAFQLPTSHYC